MFIVNYEYFNTYNEQWHLSRKILETEIEARTFIAEKLAANIAYPGYRNLYLSKIIEFVDK